MDRYPRCLSSGADQSQFELRAAIANKDVSAESLVYKALRLYPPTRRVHRAFKWTETGEHVTMSADIESCHTASNILGPDAATFNPARWSKLTKEQKDAFMPFGSSAFVCPAKPVFGPRMIALIVGTLLSELHGDWKLHSNDNKVMKEFETGKRLRLDREAYDDVFIVGGRHG